MSNNNPKHQISKKGFKKVQQEYQELKKVKRPQVVERVQKARAMGDLSENSEYHSAKESLRFIDRRIRELDEIINNAQVLDEKLDVTTVQIGNKVVIKHDNKKEEYMIVGEYEADPLKKKISSSSPIGQALIGKKSGDKATVKTPAGEVIYDIIHLE